MNFLSIFFVFPLILVSCQETDSNILKKDTIDSRYNSSFSVEEQKNNDAQKNSSVFTEQKNNQILNQETNSNEVKPSPNEPNNPGEWVPKNIEEAFTYLLKSTNASKAYRVNLKWYRPKDYLKPDLSLSPASSDFISGSERTYLITRWHRLESDQPCDLMMEYGGRAAQNLSTVAVYPTGCTPDLLNPRRNGYGNNRYGVRNCDSEKATFLGIKNIDAFINSFGVRLECTRGEYFSIHEIWYHPTSNHPYRKVLESGGYARPSINGPSFPEIAQQQYENLSDVKPSNEFEIKPPNLKVQFSLEGAVKHPGVKNGIAMCHLRRDGNFASVYVPTMPIFFQNGGQYIHGLWEPSFQVGSGTYSFGVFSNRNRFGLTIPNGNASIQFEKLGNTMYHRVNISGFISLISKDASNPNQYAGVKGFSSFYCFANPENVDESTSFRDQNVGDIFDW